MKLVELKVNEFCDVLSSDAPAPGGGSTAALEGAVGAALTAMVASLTLGKKKYAEYEDIAKETIEKANQIKIKFIDVLDRDTEAFNGVSAVFAMPKNTDDEKAARKEAMQKALKACTETPMEMMELCLESLKVTESILGKFNTSAASDLGVSALSIKAAVQGAWLNVLINLAGINDEEYVKEYKAKGQKILDQVLPLADKIYNEILSII